jgi:hypothetical protein
MSKETYYYYYYYYYYYTHTHAAPMKYRERGHTHTHTHTHTQHTHTHTHTHTPLVARNSFSSLFFVSVCRRRASSKRSFFCSSAPFALATWFRV